MASPEQCAVGPDGKLLPATAIQWYNDPDDKAPLPQPAPVVQEGRGHRKKSAKFAQVLRAEWQPAPESVT
ncbi:hypothetical protein C8R46DRAFT_1313992 [Mycena filopes]|nr:hypothetical protein C8R46DRAFT_1313992 [Mycena filopes]